MGFSLNLPVNGVSFGQVSTLILREIFARDPTSHPPLFLIGEKPDLSSQEANPSFLKWIEECVNRSYLNHSRDTPCFKLWHLTGSFESPSKIHNLITFYELDAPTPSEINVARSADNLFFTNKYTQEVFENFNVKSNVIPLAFDKYNFKKLNKKYFDDDRITFNLCGKFENRKNHAKIIREWVKKYGNDNKYSLQCAIYNPFLSEPQNKQLFADSLDRKSVYNVNFLGHMVQNELYNDFLNSGDVIIGMSGGEGWGLPEFQSVGVGKHAVILNATGYREWANEENSVMVEPSGKKEAYDGMFFKKGNLFNQGNIFDFSGDDFIDCCEEVIKRVENDRMNHEGLKIQEKFTISKTLDAMLSVLS